MGQKLYFKLLFISSPNIDGLEDSFTVRPSKQFVNTDLWSHHT